ncbi:hypothetical protein AB4851_20420 [Burkholderia sp. 22PA0099]|uniref:hypothetical protein n=1 Tax=Burkholderia sp. 22PA0099 TaxID=3237372 RepID=UPI0039C44467
MRHPAMRRTRRHSRPDHDDGLRRAEVPASQPAPAPSDTTPEASDGPADGEHNQGGARPEGLDYQRDLGSEQDA